MRGWLLDTGPLVAYLDGSEPDHQRVVARLDTFTGGVFDLLTLDRRGFTVYRSARGKHFSLLLDRP